MVRCVVYQSLVCLLSALQRTMAYCLVKNLSTGLELMSEYICSLIHPTALGGKDGWFTAVMKGAVAIQKELCFMYRADHPEQVCCH